MWSDIQDKTGQKWQLSPEGLSQFVRQSVYAQLLREKSHLERKTEKFDIFGPIKVNGPELVSVETDFEGISKAKKVRAHVLYRKMHRHILDNGHKAFDELVQLRIRIKQDGDELRKMQRMASTQTMANVDRLVAKAQFGEKAATVIRDLSATTLVIGATFLTGGAAATVLGGGSALKGIGKYQDSGNVGAGVLEASGTFVVGLINIAPALAEGGKAVSLGERVVAPALKNSERIVLMLVGAEVDAAMEVGKSVINGDGAKEAFAKGGVRFLTDAATGGAGMKLDAVKFLGKTGLPVVARLVTDTGMAVASDKAVDETGKTHEKHETHKPSSFHHVRDCHATIPRTNTDGAYIRALVLRSA